MGPYRESALVPTKPERQLAAPLRRRMFFRQRGSFGIALVLGVHSFVLASGIRHGWSAALCFSLVVLAGYSTEVLRRVIRHRRRIHVLRTGTLTIGRVVESSRRWWKGGYRLRVELADGEIVTLDADRRHELCKPVRLAYEPGRAERAFLMEDLPDELRLDGDAWEIAGATPPPSPPASLPLPPPRRP